MTHERLESSLGPCDRGSKAGASVRPEERALTRGSGVVEGTERRSSPAPAKGVHPVGRARPFSPSSSPAGAAGPPPQGLLQAAAPPAGADPGGCLGHLQAHSLRAPPARYQPKAASPSRPPHRSRHDGQSAGLGPRRLWQGTQ